MNTFGKRIERMIDQYGCRNVVVVFMDRNGECAKLPFREWKAQGYTFDSFIGIAGGNNLNEVKELLDMVDSVID